MSWYNMRLTPDGYRVVKFDNLFWVEQIYNIAYRRGRFYCDCPQGMKAHTCRHRDMVPIFNQHKAVDSGKFYDYDNQEWHPSFYNRKAA